MEKILEAEQERARRGKSEGEERKKQDHRDSKWRGQQEAKRKRELAVRGEEQKRIKSQEMRGKSEKSGRRMRESKKRQSQESYRTGQTHKPTRMGQEK